MARKLPRWALIGGIVAGATVAAAVVVRRLFGGGYDERPLGEPVAYPVVGSGTGFPEPTSADHTETLNRGVTAERDAPMASPHDGPAGSAVGEPIFRTESAAPMDIESPHIGAGTPTAGAASTAASPDIEELPTQQMPSISPATAAQAHAAVTPPSAPNVAAPTGTGSPARPAAPQAAGRPALTETPQPLSDDPSGPTTAVHSEPAQRRPTPLTEEQAESNARLHVHQEQLYGALPGLTPRDLVESDGDLDALALIAADRSNVSPDDARARIDAILGTGANQKADEGIEPDLQEER